MDTDSHYQLDVCGLLLRTDLPFSPAGDEVIYVDGTGDVDADRFVAENVDSFEREFAKRGMRFIHLPTQGERLQRNEAMWHYYFPDGNIPEDRSLTSLPNDYMLQFMKNPDNRPQVESPGLLRFICEFYTGSHVYNRYGFPAGFHEVSDVPHFVEQAVQYVMSETVRPSAFYAPSRSNWFDESFDAYIESVLKRVEHDINVLRQAGVSEVVLARLLEPEVSLSRLVITRDYRIFLPDYNNLEIEMTPLVKTIFFLYLRYPEGIRMKEIVDCQDEMRIIYRAIKRGLPLPPPSSTVVDDELFFTRPSQHILDLCNPANNSLNEKVARVKQAFVTHFHDRIASNYYITGTRGEAKRITLPRELVTWE